MITVINALANSEHIADLRREAQRRRQAVAATAARRGPTDTRAPVIALRLAGADEAHLVRRLAELDEAPMPAGRVMLALVDGEAIAALSLGDGRVVADPFARTAEAIALLRLRAKQEAAGTGRGRLRAALRLRAA